LLLFSDQGPPVVGRKYVDQDRAVRLVQQLFLRTALTSGWIEKWG
jgi:hypothetical protein